MASSVSYHLTGQSGITLRYSDAVLTLDGAIPLLEKTFQVEPTKSELGGSIEL